jgi:hypothetical protein
MAEPTSFKPEVLAQGEWCPNALRFATKKESDAYLFDLGLRWFGFTDSRSTPCDDPVTHVWVEALDKALPIEVVESAGGS